MTEVSAQAWLLELNRQQVAAVGLHELVEVLSRPKLYHVPMSGPRSHQVLVWRDEILPVVSFANDSDGESESEMLGAAVTAIAVYQTVPGEPLRHGALQLSGMPKTVTVADNMACALPETRSSIGDLAISCFFHDNFAVPVIDLTRVFERASGP